ncbi:unnamed protein product, partial [Scytosiphon promiscuus]
QTAGVADAGRGGAADGAAGAEDRSGEGGDREAGPELDILLVQAERRREQTEECKGMMEKLRIVPNQTWGRASKPEQQRWELLACNGLVEMAAAAAEKGGAAGNGGLELPDCTARPSAASDPLIAVCAGSTTRGVPFPDDQSLALFRFLLPSLARTADCGFRYVAVVGYDVGDGFFDGAAGRAKTLSWFASEVSQPAALRGLSIELELVRVDNQIKKPGPVFTAVTKAAYDRGADYIYRVNDDSEMHTPWAKSFVNALEAMGPPYGVVGPESLNKNILVHDFTHRVHMEIFDKQYYPPSLTDWFVDDWISRVYGNSRTIRAKNCKVAHGQRYKEDSTKAGSVNGLVAVGARKISAWAKAHGAEEAAGQILSDKLDGKSAKQAHARDIP